MTRKPRGRHGDEPDMNESNPNSAAKNYSDICSGHYEDTDLKGDYMSRTITTTVFAVAVAMLGSSITGALADSKRARNHPRRDQVNDRLANQDRRINKEYREGELTRGQANRLHREDRAIRREERTMSGLNNGHITPAEQKSLNQQENAVSKQIGQ
jgi:hypothetical protein